MAELGFGSYSEYSLVTEQNIGTLPESATFEEGSMLGIPYLTAVRALFQKYVYICLLFFLYLTFLV